jgi:outer membrane receptor protein involved in Fe transport
MKRSLLPPVLPCVPRPPLRALALLGVLSTLALTSSVQAQVAPANSAADAGDAAGANAGGVQKLPQFYVNDSVTTPFAGGTNMDIPRTSNDVQPYTIIDREAIDESNAVNLSDFLQQQLTQNTTGLQYDQEAGGPSVNTRGLSQVNLNGLGTLQTLILIDGHRTASVVDEGTIFQPNINQIPLAAVDHVEVLPSSASAIYGASAAGGVVNIILKKNYVGAEVDASYLNTMASDAPRETYSAIVGFTLDPDTHVSVFGNYGTGKPVDMQARPFIINYYLRALHNDPAIFYSNTSPYQGGTTPNIVLDPAAVNGYNNPSNASLVLKNGTSLNSLSTYVPIGTSPSTSTAALDAGLLANAGQQNLNFGPGVLRNLDTRIVNPPQNDSYSVSVTHDFGPKVEFFASYAANFFTEPTQYAPWSNSASSMTIAVPGNAPNNPFQQNVLMTLPMAPYYSSAPYTIYQSTRNANFGLVVHLPGDWVMDADYTWSEDMYQIYETVANFDSPTTIGAFAPLLYNGTVNPFVDTEAYPVNLRSYLGPYVIYDLAGLGDFNLRASGSLWDLPGGKPKLTAALESRVDTVYPYTRVYYWPPLPGQSVNISDGYLSTSGSRQATEAAYLETELPFVSSKNHVPFVDDLEVQLAGRIEKYSDTLDNFQYVNMPDAVPPSLTITGTGLHKADFSSANQTIGFKYRPVKALTLRASLATAFVPPTPVQLEGNPAAIPAVSAVFYDPKLNQSYTTMQVSTGGNANLQPQKTRVYDFGVIWEPEDGMLKGLRVNLEYNKIYEYDLIQTPSLQQVVNTPGLQSDVTRDPTTGAITLVTLQSQNLAEEYTDAWNASLDYRKGTPIGTFNLHVGGTMFEHFKAPPAAGLPMVEYVGFADDGGVLKTKINGTLTWLIGRHWTVGWNTTYFDGYKVAGSPGDPEYNGAVQETLITTSTGPTGSNTIPAQVYHNAFASYRFDRTGHGYHRYLDGVTVQVGIDDVFNTPPPFDAYASIAPFYYSPYGNVLLRSYVVKVKKEF